MAILTSGILGDVRGKVANVVGGGWKGKNYVRKHVIPANPQTDLQVAQRSKMSLCVAYGKPTVGPILQPFLDKFVKGMSGFNDFVSRNVAHFGAVPAPTAVRLVSGPLYAGSFTTLVPDASDKQVTVQWALDLGTNGAATDQAIVACRDRTTGNWGFSATNKTRADGATGYVVTCVLTAGQKCDVHLIFAKLSDSGIVQMIGQIFAESTVIA